MKRVWAKVQRHCKGLSGPRFRYTDTHVRGVGIIRRSIHTVSLKRIYMYKYIKNTRRVFAKDWGGNVGRGKGAEEKRRRMS